MPRKSTTRAAKGAGTIRKRKDGTYEARYTVGRDPGTGKQVQKSIYGKTESEVRKKLTAVTNALDENRYIEPSRMSISQWLDEWMETYKGDLTEGTRAKYDADIRVNIKPYVGNVKLQALDAHQIQKMILQHL